MVIKSKHKYDETIKIFKRKANILRDAFEAMFFVLMVQTSLFTNTIRAMSLWIPTPSILEALYVKRIKQILFKRYVYHFRNKIKDHISYFGCKARQRL